MYSPPSSEANALERSLAGLRRRADEAAAELEGGGRLLKTALDEDEIQNYIATGEPMDKAGAYGAQGKGALFVEHIDGDFFNVMGLPLCRLGIMLKEQGVRIL